MNDMKYSTIMKDSGWCIGKEKNLNRLGFTRTEAIDWNLITLPMKPELCLKVLSRITNSKNTDCKVYIDRKEFDCHILVLQFYSKLCSSYGSSKKIKLVADKCSPASFALIYKWMISDGPSYKELTRENVLDIFNAAIYLEIQCLIRQCWALINDSNTFSEYTAFLLFLDAKRKNLPEVRKMMLTRIEKFFLVLVSSLDWLQLDLRDVHKFLKSNYIYINSEMEVLMSALRWLKHDMKNRYKYKSFVLRCVRFGNLRPAQLLDIKRNTEVWDLAIDADIYDMIDDCLSDSVLSLEEPSTRNFSRAEKAYFSYREFLIYLAQYRRAWMIEQLVIREKQTNCPPKQ